MVDCKGCFKYRLTTYIDKKLKELYMNSFAGYEQLIDIHVKYSVIFNVFKSSLDNWSNSVLPTQQIPKIFIGDFNL